MESNTLESVISKVAFDIVNDKILDKNEIDKLLGVLSNDGVYAMWVYAKAENNIKENNLMEKFDSLFKIVNFTYESNKNWEKFFQAIAENPYNLLFLKDLLEKTLIYARYHAKAMGD
ncbi:hypothetical protein [Thermoanaerobacter uzonensis]|uniref:hypothetical protein n=1 Tax=Thermoanaerobacter uzonensis TaxID=447593 RepID=UPI003D769BAE